MRALLAIAMMLALGACQTAAPIGTSPYARAEDRPLKAALEATGVVETTRDVVAYFPAHALTDEQRAAIVARLDRGVRAAKRFTQRTNWSYHGDRRVYFYFPDARFISHAPGGNSVYIPLWRIRDDQSPWLHEALHILLWPPGRNWLDETDEYGDAHMPLWLYEGLPDVLAAEISAQENLAYFMPMMEEPPSELDAVCARHLATPVAGRIIPVIGARGRLPELYGDERQTYAPAFYACSASFTTYLRQRYGYGPLLDAIGSYGHEIDVLEATTNLPLENARANCLTHIQVGE